MHQVSPAVNEQQDDLRESGDDRRVYGDLPRHCGGVLNLRKYPFTVYLKFLKCLK